MPTTVLKQAAIEHQPSISRGPLIILNNNNNTPGTLLVATITLFLFDKTNCSKNFLVYRMKQYLITLVLLSLFFTQLEMRDCKANNRTFVYFAIAMHHLFQLMLFVTPFMPFFKKAPLYIWYLYLAIFMYLTIQNTMIHSEKSQSCVVSIFTNRECDFPENAALKDPMYYTGLKNNLHAYKKLYTYVVFSYMVYIIWLIRKK